ncbi:MAG: monofunctional biosynthetic peptidoglycan transglycosylase [Polyangiales bacterium]
MERPSRRQMWIAASALVAVVIGVVVFLWVPTAARRAVDARAARYGLHVADWRCHGLTSLRCGAFALEGEGKGVRVAFEGLRVDIDLGAYVLGRGLRLESLGADAATIDVDLDSAAFRAILAARRSARASEGGASPKGARLLPSEVTFERVDLRVRERDGELLAVDGARVRKEGGELVGSAAAVRLGSAPGDVVELKEPTWKAALVDGRPSLTEFDAPSGVLAVARAGKPGEQSPPSLRDRLVGVRERLRAASGDQVAEGELDAAGGTGPFARDFVLSLSGLRVEAAQGEQREAVLEGLGVYASRRADGALELRGSGKPVGGGKLEWKLNVWVQKLEAEGVISFERLPLTLFLPFLPHIPWYETEKSALAGELEVHQRGGAGTVFRGRVRLDDLALSSERIAPWPVRGIDVELEGAGTWFALERRLVLDRASVLVGPARASVAGTFEWASDHYLVQASAELPPTSCTNVMAAVPNDLLADLASFSWSGTMAGKLALALDSRDLNATKLSLSVSDRCQFLTVPAAADLRRFLSPFVHRVVEPDDSTFEMETGPGTPNWTPIDQISPFMVHAVLAHEDGGFFGHAGFAVWAIEGALKHNLEAGRYVQGASTITMQLAKNVFLHREKTLARKVQEVLLTWWLETGMDKRSILELYLNVIEYGPSVYGVRSATKYYFGREPRDISLAEAAFLATILPNPKLYASSREKGLSNSVRNRMKQLIKHMHAKGRVDATALEEANREIDAFQFHAPTAPPPPQHVLMGRAAPLPYEKGADVLAPWEDDGAAPSNGDDAPSFE